MTRQSRRRSFDPLAAWAVNEFSVTDDGEAERVAGFGVTSRFFDALPLQPRRARTFVPAGSRAGRAQQRALVGAAVCIHDSQPSVGAACRQRQA